MKRQVFAVLLASVCLLALRNLPAQEKAPEKSTEASVPVSGPRAEFLTELKVEQDKFIKLAEAIPADKYFWRPAPDVRSVGEVYLHVAAANYNLPTLFGVAAPAGFKPQGFDKSTTDKARIVETLNDSFAHLRRAVISMPDSDLEKQLDWFGGKNTYRGILLFIMRHMAEHLGQSIAYARVNGIVPPWTEEQQQKSKAAAKSK